MIGLLAVKSIQKVIKVITSNAQCMRELIYVE